MSKKAKRTNIKLGWGFDTASIDRRVKPQDDFYHYANGSWLKKAKIPAEESRWGAFTMLRYATEHQLKKLVESTRNPLVRGIYASATDMGRRTGLGARPMEKLRRMMRDISSPQEFLKALAHLHKKGISGFWHVVVDQDSKDSTKYILHVWQGGLGMPDRDYYLKNEPEQKRVRTAYVRHIEKLYKLVGASSKEAARTAKVVMDIETRLAQHSMNKEDLRDSQKTYHKKSSRQLAALTPALNWKKYFADTGAGAPASVIVGQPDFFRAVNRMLKETPLERIKIYLEWHVLNSCASLLSKPFVKEQFDFYSRTLAGSKKMKPLWRRGLSALNTVGDELGKLYVAKHFPPKSKQVMDRLVSDLFELYAKRIQRLDWMSAPTKRKALRKLRAMRRKIGYPSKWKNYEGLRIRSDDFFGNMLRASEHEYKRELKKLRGPVDRTEWFMTPQTVNAYFAPNLNEIVFPAAILQWPFFSPAADDAVNYAAIGSVIGHEITHGFDDKGSQFDYKGNLKSWWTPGDRKRFMRKAQIIAKQADAYEVEPGVHLNGQLTLGENIADLGGLAIAYDAYQKHLMKIGRKNIEGLSPEERFFLGFAQYERELSRPEMRKLHALTDHHAEASFRINGPLSNFAPFYETFKVTKKNKLYRAPKNRAEIW